MSEAAFSLVPKPGDIVAGKYRVECVLGSGGMGIVLSAIHVALDERVALKLLRPEAARRDDAARRFLREARAAIRIRSEHVARVHDVGTLDSGAHYIVMEHLTGSDLARHVDEHGPLAVDEAVTFVLMACEAVAEAHALGIVHRDLKPSNLFLCRRADASPYIKVLDFGVSKFKAHDDRSADSGAITAADSERPPPLTMSDAAPPTPSDSASTTAGITATSARIGSPRYMAPEQMLSARDVDARADVWALGAILYELVAGRPAFDASEVRAVEEAVRTGRFAKLRSVRPGIPQSLDAAVTRCLSVDREARFANVGAFALAIAPLASADGLVAARRAARVCDVAVDDPKAPRSRLLAIGIGVVAIGAAFAIGAAANRRESRPTPAVAERGLEAPSTAPVIAASTAAPPSSTVIDTATSTSSASTTPSPIATARAPTRVSNPSPSTLLSSSASPALSSPTLKLDPGHMFDEPH